MSINRYPGPKPFKTEEEALFFGRENDKAEFYRYIYLHQLVTLFGVSGYGKSSLINAGVIPLIKANNPATICVEIRFGPYDEKAENASPTDKVIKTLGAFSLENAPFLVENFLETDDAFWPRLKNLQLAQETSQFIFFFDQFEELFTYPEDQIQLFKEQLADILYTTVPKFYRDQEEKLDDESVPDDFRIPFYRKPDVKVVFAIRADRLGHLEEIKDLHPAALKNCFELKALRAENALEAIREPADLRNVPTDRFKTVRFRIEEKLLSALVNSLKDEKGLIQPSTLQIICWQMEDQFVPLTTDNDPDDERDPLYELKFDEFDQNHDGNITEEIENIFDNYYRGTIENKLPESLQDAAFSLVETTLVQSGQRIPFERDYLVSDILVKQLKVGSKQEGQAILDVLANASLLKVEQDSQRRMIYELGHDTLVEPVSKAASVRKEREEQLRLIEETERARLETKEARDREKAARKQANDFKRLKEDAEINAAVAIAARERARFRSILAITGLIIAVIVAAFAIHYRREADAQKEKANKRQQEAEANLKTAKEFFKQTNQKEAQRLLGVARRYMEYNEEELALENLNNARQILNYSFESYGSHPNPVSDSGLNLDNSLLAEIEYHIHLCNKKVKR